MSKWAEQYKHSRRTLGVILRHARTTRQATLRSVAQAAGLSYSQLQRLEDGAVQHPAPDKLARLAGTLDLPLADLFAYAGYISPRQLPTFPTYLAMRYPALSGTAITELDRHLQQLVDTANQQA